MCTVASRADRERAFVGLVTKLRESQPLAACLPAQ